LYVLLCCGGGGGDRNRPSRVCACVRTSLRKGRTYVVIIIIIIIIFSSAADHVHPEVAAPTGTGGGYVYIFFDCWTTTAAAADRPMISWIILTRTVPSPYETRRACPSRYTRAHTTRQRIYTSLKHIFVLGKVFSGNESTTKLLLYKRLSARFSPTTYEYFLLLYNNFRKFLKCTSPEFQFPA